MSIKEKSYEESTHKGLWRRLALIAPLVYIKLMWRIILFKENVIHTSVVLSYESTGDCQSHSFMSLEQTQVITPNPGHPKPKTLLGSNPGIPTNREN